MSNNPFGDNPYQAPKTTNFGSAPGGGDPNARGRVQGPAMGLLVFGGIGIALCLLGLVLNMIGVGVGAAAAGGGQLPPEAQAQLAGQAIGGVIGIISGLLGIASSGFIIFAALKMKNLEAHGMAFAAAVVAMLPIVSPCCLLGLPLGIWAITVLNDPNVKAAFRK